MTDNLTLDKDWGDFMYYIVETNKSFAQASTDLESAVKHHGFGGLRPHVIEPMLAYLNQIG